MPSPAKFFLKPWFLALSLALLVLAAGAAVTAWWLGRVQPAPDVTFVSLKGEKISLQSLRGKVVLLNFWSTTCAPCMREMPRLAEAYQQLRPEGLEVIAVAASYDQPNIVLDYFETRHLPFPVALDLGGDIAQTFGAIKVVPTTYLIGRDGHVVQRLEGELDMQRVRPLLTAALAAR